MLKQAFIAAGIMLGGMEVTNANEEIDESYKGYALIGINRTDAKLHRFSFKDNTHKEVGVVKDKNGRVLTGIDASSYIAGNMNMFAYWTDPDDGLCKLVYVNVLTGEAVYVGSDLGTGHAGDAVAAQMDGHGLNGKRWVNFVILQAKKVTTNDIKITGGININPNNSPHNEFNLTKTGGEVITRDNLKSDSTVDNLGTFYSGGATRVLVKPKGNGNQNNLKINGTVMPVNNNTTYVFTGTMTVRVWNDNIKNSKAMGHWWIDIDCNGTVEVDGTLQSSSTDVHRLVRVDHRNGNIEHSMTLTRMYDGLATTDGVKFYACSKNKLYLINITSETETLIGNLPGSDIRAMEFVGNTLMGFDSTSDSLFPINTITAQAITNGATLDDIVDLDTINFLPLADDPVLKLSSYD